ncbi:hypothetical protein ACFLSS_00250 [Bacteroidota bacterium]
MKGAIISEPTTKVEESSTYSFLTSFILEPFKSGLFGFACFFTVLIITKGISYLMGFSTEYIVISEDALFSLLGLVIVFIIKLTENIKDRASN